MTETTRRDFLRAIAGIPIAPSLAQNPAPWNFVFVLADDLGWSDLGVYGADLHETPNLDRFASGAMRFTQAYSASPVCSPTRASIMTGKHPARLGITIWHEGAVTPPGDRRLIPATSEPNLPLSEVTLAESLHGVGYLTAHIGKWHLGTAGYYPEAQGFDINIGGAFWGAPQTYFFPYRGSRHFRGEYRYVPGLHWGASGEYLTDRLTDEALNVIARSARRPFFLNLWQHAPHTPIEAPSGTRAYFGKKIKPGQNHQNAGYAAMVKNLDDNFGRLLQGLDEAGLSDRTVVVFMSDNGGYTEPFEKVPVTSNAPLRSGKGSLYEGGIRVPLMVRWPGVTKPGGVCDVPVISMDLHQTILDIAGIRSENSPSDGLSLVPLLRNRSPALPPRDLFFHYPHYYPTTTPVSAVRSGSWKLLEYFEDARLELYDLASDPGEQNDVAAQRPDFAKELHQKLLAWRESVHARVPAPNPAWDAPRK